MSERSQKKNQKRIDSINSKKFLRKKYLHNYVMAMKEKFKNLLQLPMLQVAEIKEQINDGDMAKYKN